MRMGLEIVVLWLVGHVGVADNEQAKEALTHPSIDYNILQTLQDYIHIIEKFIKDKWLVVWNSDTQSVHYHSIQPLISNKIKYKISTVGAVRRDVSPGLD